MADTQAVVEATSLQLAGAGCFGGLLGWMLFAINRQRKDEPTINDLVTILGAIGGTAVLALFPARTDLFGAYGIGLAVGFGLYFLILVLLVGISDNFNVDWFLDGRRKRPVDPYHVPTRVEQASNVIPAMGIPPGQQSSQQHSNREG